MCVKKNLQGPQLLERSGGTGRHALPPTGEAPDDLLERRDIVRQATLDGLLRAEHQALAEALPNLFDGHAASLRHGPLESGPILAHALLHIRPGRLRQRLERVPERLVLAVADERDRLAPH